MADATATERDSLLPRKQRKQDRKPEDLSAAERFVIIASVTIGVALGALDSTIVATLFTSIAADFNSSQSQGWLATSYLLSTATATPIYGRLADLFGRRWANLTAVGLFTLGTLGCALAPDMQSLIAARFVAGLGGGGLMTTASITASDLVSLQQRGVVQGTVNVLFGLGSALGGPLGGVMADTVGWRFAFYIQLPILGVCAILVWTFSRYSLEGQQPKTLKDKLLEVDYLGSLSLLVWVGALLLTMSYKTDELDAWSSPRVLASGGIAVLFFFIFGLIEARFARRPIAPLWLYRQRSPLFINLTYFFSSFVTFSALYFFPSFFEVIQGQTAAQAGAHLVPYSVGIPLGSLGAGLIVRYTKKYYWLVVGSAALPVLAYGAFAFIDETWPPALLWLVIVPSSVGYASIITTLLVALIASVERSHVAVGTGVTYLHRYCGQVIGVGVSASILQGALTAALRQRFHGPDATELIDKIRHSVTMIKSLPTEQRHLATEAYKAAFHRVFEVNLIFWLLSVLCCLPIREYPVTSSLGKAPERAAADREQEESLRP